METIDVILAVLAICCTIGGAAWRLNGSIHDSEKRLVVNMAGLEKRINGLEVRMDGLEKRMDNLAADVRGINEHLRHRSA